MPSRSHCRSPEAASELGLDSQAETLSWICAEEAETKGLLQAADGACVCCTACMEGSSVSREEVPLVPREGARGRARAAGGAGSGGGVDVWRTGAWTRERDASRGMGVGIVEKEGFKGGGQRAESCADSKGVEGLMGGCSVDPCGEMEVEAISVRNKFRTKFPPAKL